MIDQFRNKSFSLNEFNIIQFILKLILILYSSIYIVINVYYNNSFKLKF
jgi:hypothetical protein